MTPPITVTPAQSDLSDTAKTSLAQVIDFFKHIRTAGKAGEWKNNGSVLTKNFGQSDFDTLKSNLLALLREVDFTLAFTNAGIPQDSSFSGETLRILKGNILPYVYPPKDAEAIIHQICADKGDCHLFAALINAFPTYDDKLTTAEKAEILNDFRTQAGKAVEIVSYRIASLGMHEEIFIRAGRDEALITPFIEQNREINALQRHIEKEYYDKFDEDLAQAKLMVKQCANSIALIDKAAEKNGASLTQTFILRKLELLHNRLLLLLSVAYIKETEEAFTALIKLLHEVVLAETNPRGLRDFISSNINLIAFRITENKRKTGEHYIAASKSEYWDLFISACGGGLIVSVMVIIKLLMHKMELPLLWECLFYSINYAVGFVVIQMLNFTLATKQPAMTAAYIAASIDDIREDSSRYHHLASTIATVSRSQLASFAGNLLVAFPFTLCWVFFIGLALHHPFVNSEKGEELLSSVSPLTSFAAWYAAITGVLLFMSGIISGFGDNKVVVSRIGERIAAHPWLKKHMSPTTLHKFAAYIEKNLGPLSGNIAFGFMLGFATFLGKITGLPIDIRHITFSTGNIAVGMMGVGFHVTFVTILDVLLGLFIMGLLNFAVSFFLALQVAARSRGLRLRDYPDMIIAVWHHFRQHPSHFFYPPKEEEKSVEVVTS